MILALMSVNGQVRVKVPNSLVECRSGVLPQLEPI